MDRCWPDAPSQRSRLPATSGRSCSLPNRLFFETQPFLANESPNRTPIGLDPALRQFGRQAPRREPTGMETMTQPDGDVSDDLISVIARQATALAPLLPEIT